MALPLRVYQLAANTIVLVSNFENLPTRTTPIALPHPRTGETVLYVSEQMTQGIDTIGKPEGEELLQELFRHLYRPESVYSHDWREHDLVAWDNISIQHGRPNVTLEGAGSNAAQGVCTDPAAQREPEASDLCLIGQVVLDGPGVSRPAAELGGHEQNVLPLVTQIGMPLAEVAKCNLDNVVLLVATEPFATRAVEHPHEAWVIGREVGAFSHRRPT